MATAPEDIVNEEEVTASPEGVSAMDALSEATAGGGTPVGNNDNANVISKFTGTRTPQPTVEGIMSAGTYGPQAYSTYFPSMQNEIQHGTYSGSIVGSNPIYAPSALYPFGLIDARKQAIARAADAKVAEQDKWSQKMMDIGAPKTKRTPVQSSITKNFYEGIKEFVGKASRENPNVDPNKAVLQNPEFQKYLDDWRDVAAHEDSGVDSIAAFTKEAESGDKAVFGPQKEVMNDFQNNQILRRLTSTDPEIRAQAKQEMAQVRGLKAMRDPQKVMEEGVKALQSDVSESVGTDPQGLYDMITSTKVTSVPQQRIQNYVRHVYDTEYGGNEAQTGFDFNTFAKGFASQFGRKVEKQVQTASTKEGGDYSFHMDDQALSTAPVSVSSQTDASGGVGSYSLANSYNIPANMQKTFEMAIPSDAKDVSGNIISGKTTGNVTSTVSQVGNVVTVHKKGSSADGKAIDVSKPDELKHYKDSGFTFSVVPQAVVTVEGYDEKGKKSPGQNSTIAVNLNHIKNNVMKTNPDGSYKTGVNIPLLESKAKELQDQYNKKTYTLGGKEYDEAKVTAAAKASNLSVDEYIKAFNSKK